MAGRLNNTLRSAVLAVTLLLLALCGLEFWLRGRAGSAAAIVVASVPADIQLLLQPSESVHHELRSPGVYTVTAGQSGPAWSVRINSWGCRGPEPDESSAKYRILLLGDETIFGLGVSEEETVAARLSQFLPEATAEQIEIINGAVPGDCPALALLRYQHRLDELHPSLVILHVDMSDIADDGRYRSLLRDIDGLMTCAHASFQLPSKSPSLLQRSSSQSAIVGSLLTTVRSRTASMSAVGNDMSDGPFAWISDSPPEQPLQIRNALEPIAALKALLDKADVKLLVTMSPVRWQVVETAGDSELSRRWSICGTTPFASRLPFGIIEHFCRQHGLRCLNTEAAFRSVRQPEKLFSDSNPGPSQLGLALYGRELAKFLTEDPPARW
jgi:hypothetical protein